MFRETTSSTKDQLSTLWLAPLQGVIRRCAAHQGDRLVRLAKAGTDLVIGAEQRKAANENTQGLAGLAMPAAIDTMACSAIPAITSAGMAPAKSGRHLSRRDRRRAPRSGHPGPRSGKLPAAVITQAERHG